MTPLFDIWIEGLPITKGSMKLIPPKIHGMNPATGKPYRPRQVADNPGLKAWQEMIGWHARIALNRGSGPRDTPVDLPVVLRMLFVLDRLVARRRTGDVFSKRPSPDIKPDLDKLQRAALDGLNKIAYPDDGRVVAIQVAKVYAGQLRDADGAYQRPGLRLRMFEAPEGYAADVA